MSRWEKLCVAVLCSLTIFVSVFTTASAQDPYNVGPMRVGPFSVFGNSDAVQLTVKGGVTQTNSLASFTNRAGTNQFSVSNTGQVMVPSGSGAAPSYSFNGQGDLGIYSSGAGVLALGAGGASRLLINSTGISTSVPVLAANGTAVAPAISFAEDSDMGLSSDGTNLKISTATVERVMITNGGATVFNTTTAMYSQTAANPTTCTSACDTNASGRGLVNGSGVCLLAWTSSTGVPSTCGSTTGSRRCMCTGVFQ